MVALPYN